jgi:hypothetical protein
MIGAGRDPKDASLSLQGFIRELIDAFIVKNW